jgi:hypothetical protein
MPTQTNRRHVRYGISSGRNRNRQQSNRLHHPMSQSSQINWRNQWIPLGSYEKESYAWGGSWASKRIDLQFLIFYIII